MTADEPIRAEEPMAADGTAGGSRSRRRRLDEVLVERGVVVSRSAARRAIIDGHVFIDGQPARKPSQRIADPGGITVDRAATAYVSRAGHKLAAALDDFSLDTRGSRCLDAGASTGGFTDCLLQRGARSVLAVDVGTDQFNERLRTDPRVTVRERTDIRTLDPIDLDGPFELIVADLPFISLRLVFGTFAALVADTGVIVALVKPQFEAGRQAFSKGDGIIKDPPVWHRVLDDVVRWGSGQGLSPTGLTRHRSPARLATSSSSSLFNPLAVRHRQATNHGMVVERK